MRTAGTLILPLDLGSSGKLLPVAMTFTTPSSRLYLTEDRLLLMIQ
jgi:hypothetical protein